MRGLKLPGEKRPPGCRPRGRKARCHARRRARMPWHHRPMSMVQKVLATLLVLLLVAAGYGLWVTQDSSGAPVQQQSKTVVVSHESPIPVIDQHTLQVAQRLAQYADTPEEQTY